MADAASVAVQRTHDATALRLPPVRDLPAILAALLLGLLLIQPALCLLHCLDITYPHSVGQSFDQNHMLCSLADHQGDPATRVPLPAFWPTLPVTGVMLAPPAALLLVLLTLVASCVPSLTWSPPSPPPRTITALA